MTKIELPDQLSELKLEARSQASMIAAIYMAMLNGEYDNATHLPAMWHLQNSMEDHAKTLENFDVGKIEGVA